MNDLDEAIKRIYAIQPNPGDVIVIEVEEFELTPEQQAQLVADVKPYFPDNQVIVAVSLSLRAEGGDASSA